MIVVMLTFVIAVGCALAQLNGETIYENAYREYLNHDFESSRRDFLLIAKSSPPALNSCYFLGRIALASGHPSEAVTWLERVAGAEPPIFDARAQLGKAYMESGQFEKALDMTLKALHATPWDGSLHYRLGRIYQRTGESEMMKREFAASARLKSADQRAVIQLSECVQELADGKKPEAMQIRQQFLQDAQLDPDALVALGKIFADAGLQAEALDPFRTATTRDPGSFEAQYDLGLAFLNLGRARDALAPLEAGLRLLPRSPDANSALALAYVMTRQYGRAVPVLEQLPQSPRVMNLLGLSYLRSGVAAKAVPLLRKAAVDPKDPKAYFLLIEALNATDDPAGALAVAEQAAARFPETAQVHLAKAQQLARMGKYATASPEFKRTLELAPEQIDAKLGLAEAFQKGGDYAASLEVYAAVLQQDAANVTAQLGVARDLILLRRFPEARERLESAVAAHPENSPLHFELSRVYARLGERDRAAEQTQIVQDLRRADPK